MSNETEYVIAVGAMLLLNRVWSSVEHALTSRKIDEIHVSTNSMKDSLVKAAEEAGHAKGLRSATDLLTHITEIKKKEPK